MSTLDLTPDDLRAICGVDERRHATGALLAALRLRRPEIMAAGGAKSLVA